MAGFKTAYIGIGSNLGDRRGNIDKAMQMLSKAGEVELCKVSKFIETTALGDADQPPYLNAAAKVKTVLCAADLHRRMCEIETLLGRRREDKWSARTIDLDLLLFEGQIIKTADLILPHPRMHLRSFVLRGLCEIDGGLVHPVMGVSMDELAGRLNGGDFAPDANRPQLVSIAGIIGVGKTTLAKRLCEVLSGQFLPEPYDTNPFLPKVYAGQRELALDSQLYFLTARSKQLSKGALEPGRIAITDYVFEKERIYATRLLDRRQLSLYEDIYGPFAATVAAPALVIYLTDSTENCLRRIRKRNRPYEQRIGAEFLESLQCGYEQLFADWKRCPVIRLCTSRFDCSNDRDVENLAGQARQYIAAASDSSVCVQTSVLQKSH